VILPEIPPVSGVGKRFVFFKVSNDLTGEFRYFISLGNSGHLKIKAFFERWVRKCDTEGRLVCETLGGAFFLPFPEKKFLILNLQSEDLGPVRNLSELLFLLRDNFPGFRIIYSGLEDATG
jgi:hypothetical protein